MIVDESECILIVENLRLTGGIRQALKLIDEIQKNNKCKIAIIKRENKSIISKLGFIRDLFLAYCNKPRNISLMIIDAPISTQKNYVITTSKKTLNYVDAVESKQHIHYMQHIEIWDFLNSEFYENYCAIEGYPDSDSLVSLIDKYPLNKMDNIYIDRLKKISNFYTVSVFLEKIIKLINQNAKIIMKEVKPHINSSFEINKYGILMIIRGIPFKGDKLAIKILERLKNQDVDIRVVASSRMYRVLKKFQTNKIKVNYGVSDKELGALYSRAKLVINSSLSEGFGSVPQEALAAGCNVISSNTGWILSENLINKNLHIVKKHNLEDYIYLINECL